MTTSPRPRRLTRSGDGPRVLDRGDGVERPALAGVLPLEVGPDELALAGRSGLVVFDDFQRGCGDDGLDLLEVVGVIGDHLKPAAGDQDALYFLQEGLLHEAALVVAGLGPGVGEIDVHDGDGCWRDEFAQEVEGL